MTSTLQGEVTPRTSSDAPVAPRRQRWGAALGRNWVEIGIVLVLVALSTGLHAQNMFGFPYYENDEGTYISRAWQFITTGELDVYTYRYDHAPAGWMALGAWLGLTGGTAMFGSLLESGRVFMLVLHTASTVLLYLIARRMSGGMTAGIVAVLVFAFSPLGVYFQRRVLLDNIMVFWVLLAVLLLLRKKLTLSSVVGSGIFFGIAVLTKLNAAFFGLGFLVLLWFQSAPHQRRHALAMWLAFAGGTVLMFILYALLNEELLGSPLGVDGEPLRVSLADTLALQMGRGNPAPPWDPSSSIYAAIQSWQLKDWFTMAMGAATMVGLAVLAVVRRTRNIYPLAVLLIMAGFVAFLVRGGIVLDLYITPLIPFIGLGAGLLLSGLIGWMRPRGVRSLLATIITLSVAGTYLLWTPSRYLTVDETSNQEAALEWIEENVEPGSIIVADNYAYPDLAQAGDFDDTFYFYSAEYDPEVRAIYNEDWRDVDYLLVTYEFVNQVKQGSIPQMQEALDHSELVVSFREGSSSFFDLTKYISTNGDWAQVYRVKDRNEIVLQDSWAYFLDEYVHDYGRVASAETSSVTTSADQALGLTQALAHDDEAWFRGIWQWSNDHMRHRENDGMLSWQWQTDADGDGALLTNDSACPADLRLSQLLLRAGSTWPDAADLTADGRSLVADWWEGCVFERDGLLLVDSTADGSIDDALLNPSTFDPGAYAALSEQLPEYDWQRLEDDGYVFLERLVDELGTVPNWIVLTEEGELASAEPLIGAGADSIGGEVLKLVPALVADELDGDERATRILDALQPQLIEYWQANRSLPASTTITLLAQARQTALNPRSVYVTEIAPAYEAGSGEWGEASLSDHYWGWAWHDAQSRLPSSDRVPLQ